MKDKLSNLLDEIKISEYEKIMGCITFELDQEEREMLIQYIDSLKNKIDKIKEHITYIIGITDDERILAECNLIEEELKDE